MAKQKRSSKNQAFIFSKRDFRSVKFELIEHQEFIELGRYIKYNYGPDGSPEYLSPVFGKIKEVFNRGVWVIEQKTGSWQCVTWNRITRIFLEKMTGKLKQSRLKVLVSGKSSDDIIAGFFDGAISKVIDKIKLEHKDIIIEDERVDLTTRFRRKTTFLYKEKSVCFNIPNELTDKILITNNETDRKSSVKCKNRKVNTNLLIRKIEELK